MAAPVIDEEGHAFGVVENIDMLSFIFQEEVDPHETTIEFMFHVST